MTPQRNARQRRVGEDVGEQIVIGRPVLEPARRVANGLVADAARGHPGGDHLLIGVGLRLLDARIAGQDEIGRGSAAFEFDE